jgi:hypothetical protein
MSIIDLFRGSIWFNNFIIQYAPSILYHRSIIRPAHHC